MLITPMKTHQNKLLQSSLNFKVCHHEIVYPYDFRESEVVKNHFSLIYITQLSTSCDDGYLGKESQAARKIEVIFRTLHLVEVGSADSFST